MAESVLIGFVVALFALLICGNLAVSSGNVDIQQLGAGFYDYLGENRPDILDDFENQLTDEQITEMAVNGLTVDVIGFLVNAGTLRDFIVEARNYLATVGTFTDTGYTYYTGTSSGNYSHFYTYVGDLCHEYGYPWGGSEIQYLFQDNGFFSSGEPQTVNIYNITAYNGVLSSRPYFFEFSDARQGFAFSGTSDAPTIYGTRSGGARSVIWSGACPYDFTKTLIGSFVVIPGATDTDAGAVDLPYTGNGQDFADNTDEYANDVVDGATGEQVVHYPDGRENIVTGAGVYLPFSGYDTDGNPIIDTTAAADFPIDNAVDTPATDVNAPADTTVPTDSTSFMTKILNFIRDFWTSLTRAVVNSFKQFFLPDENETRRMIGDIRQAFRDKFGYTDFDFNGIFGEPSEPQDFYLEDYSAGGLPLITAKIVDVSFLKTAVLKFRALMRAIIALLLLIYNINQLFNFLGYAGVSLGVWHPIDNDEKPDFVKDWLARGGRFRHE